jgi:hypothetical protein
MANIVIQTKNPNEPITFYMNDRLNNVLEKKLIPDLKNKDKDAVIVIDGGEGAGKSTLAFQIGKKVDQTLDLNRVTFNAEEFRAAILKAKKGQCVIYDEAFTGLSSRAALSGVNRVLVSLMMQMRQKNLFVIVVLPTFFLLEKYVALFRTRILIHVYENKGIRGYFRIYNRKKKKNLYLMGKQSLSYSGKKWKIPVFTKFKGRFYGVFALGDKKVEEEYRRKKGKALEATEHDPMSAGQIKYREQRDICIYVLRKKLDLTYEQLSNLVGDYDLELSRPQIANICAKYGDREKKEAKKERIKEEIEKNSEYTDEDDIKDGLMDEEGSFDDDSDDELG